MAGLEWIGDWQRQHTQEPNKIKLMKQKWRGLHPESHWEKCQILRPTLQPSPQTPSNSRALTCIASNSRSFGFPQRWAMGKCGRSYSRRSWSKKQTSSVSSYNLWRATLLQCMWSQSCYLFPLAVSSFSLSYQNQVMSMHQPLDHKSQKQCCKSLVILRDKWCWYFLCNGGRVSL